MNDRNIGDIIDKYQSELYLYCFALTRKNRQASEDIVSDVFWLLIEKQNQLYFDQIKAWLFRTADKYILKHRSSLARNAKKFVDTEQIAEIYTEENYSTLVSDNDMETYKRQIYEKLTTDEKVLYNYRYTYKMTLQDISAKTNMPYSTLYDKYRSLDKKIKDMAKKITDNFVC